MDLSAFSYGQIMFYGGIGLIAFSAIALIVGLVIFTAKRKKLKQQLMDKYGF